MDLIGKSIVVTATGAIVASGLVRVAALFYQGPANGLVDFRIGAGTGSILATISSGPGAIPVSVNFGSDRWERTTGLHATFTGAGSHTLTVWYD